MNEAATPPTSEEASEDLPTVEPVQAGLAVFFAWLVPGCGHFLLRRWGRGVIFLAVILVALALGCHLEGRLPWMWSGSPLQILASIGGLGSGLPYLALHFGVGYAGNLEASGYDYGSAFILTAGLMNLLLMLDVWDIASGRKE